MAGKGILILVLGFSSIFLLSQNSFLTSSQKATNDMVENLDEERALEIARSATNVVVSFYWQNPDKVDSIGTNKTYFDDVAFNGGKVTCNLIQDPSNSDLYKIVTNASYGADDNVQEKTVVVLYGPQRLTEMASYSESSGGIWWTGSDTVKGQIYCRSSIPVYNHPTFLDQVYSKSGDFKYYGGRRKKTDHYPNVDANNLSFRTELKRPRGAMNNLKAEAKSSGWYLYGSRAKWNKPSKDTMFIEIDGQNMDVKFTESDSPITYNITTKAPNKIIYANNYVVRLKGTLDGQLLIACNGSRSKGKGKILLDDDIIYADDPQDDPDGGPYSDDLLGIVAQNYVEIADTPPNQTDINIQAAIYVQSKGLTAENARTKPDAGIINFYGSLIEGRRMEVGRFDPATGGLWGYGRKYGYDERLKEISPPSFPQLAGFNVLAWYEGDTPK